MTYRANVTVEIRHYYQAEVTVEAKSKAEAKRKIQELYQQGELDLGDSEPDYDTGEITDIEFE